MPDLLAVPGWKNVWALPTGIEASVNLTVVEKSTVVSDGTSIRTTSATKKLKLMTNNFRINERMINCYNDETANYDAKIIGTCSAIFRKLR